jgi:hypothetical protein
MPLHTDRALGGIDRGSIVKPSSGVKDESPSGPVTARQTSHESVGFRVSNQ